MCVRHKTVIVTSVLKQPYSAVNIRTHADHIYTGDVSFINQEGCNVLTFWLFISRLLPCRGQKYLNIALVLQDK